MGRGRVGGPSNMPNSVRESAVSQRPSTRAELRVGHPMTCRPAVDVTALDLLSRVATGDVASFALLYRQTSPRIYGLTLRVLRSPEHAAEVTQEVYLEVWRQAGRYNASRGSALTWMSTIAHRRAVDRVRAVAATTTRDQRYAFVTLLEDVDGVWDSVAARSDAARLRQALGQLSVLQRESLTLAYFGGHTQSEIASLLDIPLGTVKTRIRNALTVLRRTLSPEDFPLTSAS